MDAIIALVFYFLLFPRMTTRFLSVIALSFLLAACNSGTPTNTPDAVESAVPAPGNEGVEEMIVVDEPNEDVMEEEVVKKEVATRVIEVTTENWQFTPSVIKAKKGEKVILRLIGKNGIHGFFVPDLGIAERVEAGRTVEVSLPTNQTGTFELRCNIICGQGHDGMIGTIIISS